MTPHVDVTPYSDEDDIEKGNYDNSPYVIVLDGTWKCDIRNDYSDRSSEFESRDFSAEKWSEVSLPCRSWQRNGKTLVPAPIEHPSRIPLKGNVSAALYKKIDIDPDFKDHQAYLRIQSVSAVHLWVNRKYVGYGEDSRTPNEFDITPYLLQGHSNEIVILSVARSDGSLLEMNYSPALSGITDNICLLFFPSTHIADYHIKSDYTAQNRSGHLSVDVDVECAAKKGKFYLEAELWDPQGKEVDRMGKWMFFDKRSQTTVTIDQTFANVASWNAEQPRLYTLVLRILDEKMRPIESTGTRFGFRTVKVEDGKLKVNGSPIMLHGTDYVDNGQSEEQMRADLTAMKRHNINAIHTIDLSPARPKLYDICDELGLYVVCDANLQPFSESTMAIATDADYSDMFIERAHNMYAVNKNHPSIIVWSLGPSNDNGVCMTNTYKEMKYIDKSRPVMFVGAGMGESTDIIVLHNPSEKALKEYKGRALLRPVVVTSFCKTPHDNAMGGLEQYWDIVKKESNFVGGFAPTWNNYTSYNKNTKQDEWHTGLGSRNARNELREVYRPFDITLQTITQDAAEFMLTNRNDFLSLSDYRVSYTLCSNLKPRIIEGDIKATVGPGASHIFKLRIPKLNLYAGEKLYIKFQVRQRNATAATDGTVLANFSFPIPARNIAKMPLPDYEQTSVAVKNIADSGILRVSNQQFDITFDMREGNLSSYTWRGKKIVVKPLQLDLWHPTDDDRANIWHLYKPEALHRTLIDIDYRRSDSAAVMVNAVMRYSNSAGSPLFDMRQSYSIFSTGDIIIDNELLASNPVPAPPQIGLKIAMGKGMDSASWFGLEEESYCDRKAAYSPGLFKNSLSRLNLNHADTRWLALHNNIQGLYIDMLDSLFNFSIKEDVNQIQVSALPLYAAVGGAVTPDPVSAPFHHSFKLHLRPYDIAENDPSDFGSIDYPVQQSNILPMPVISASSQRFNAPMKISIALPKESRGMEGVKIHYTTDGTTPESYSPIYTTPFTIDATTTVNARAIGNGHAPSFVASRTYYYDYISSIKFAQKPNTPYNKHYETALNDGETGLVEDLSHHWIGFSATNCEATVTLSKPVDIDQIKLRFAHNPEAWVFAPDSIVVMTSADGIKYSTPRVFTCQFNPTKEENNAAKLVELDITVNTNDVKYIKIIAHNIGRIPQWHRAKGLHAWIMTDEINIKTR